MLTRREWMRRTLGGAAVLAATGAIHFDALAAETITVYKSPTCGCCKKWVEYLQQHGFEVVVHEMDDLSAIKQRYGVPKALQTCHTALVSGYVVEGHVPADVIQQVLKTQPKIVGVAVPGMPNGSPGMDFGGATEHYDVIAFDRAGKTTVYAKR